jgi:hypothetical protein
VATIGLPSRPESDRIAGPADVVFCMDPGRANRPESMSRRWSVSRRSRTGGRSPSTPEKYNYSGHSQPRQSLEARGQTYVLRIFSNFVITLDAVTK